VIAAFAVLLVVWWAAHIITWPAIFAVLGAFALATAWFCWLAADRRRAARAILQLQDLLVQATMDKTRPAPGQEADRTPRHRDRRSHPGVRGALRLGQGSPSGAR
jgi:hypothetical protein